MYENNQNFVSASSSISKLRNVKNKLLQEKGTLNTILNDNIAFSSLSINARKEEIEDFIAKIDPICEKIDSVISSINISVNKINSEIENKSKRTNNTNNSSLGVKKVSSNDNKVQIKNYSGFGRVQEEKY